jgi:glycosyltransferase involved in cell wall biosynthesis
MRVGIVFHKNPFVSPTGIDLVRLRSIASGLIHRGVDAEIIAPVKIEGLLDDTVPVRRLGVLDRSNEYDLVKTCYHDSIMLLGKFRGPVVSRIVRVVDQLLPDRDGPMRQKLLHCQSLIKSRATVLVLNNVENSYRWRQFYGNDMPIVLVPTGCPKHIPEPGQNPFSSNERAIMFLGSIASPRMVYLLNQAVEKLRGVGRLHLIGLNKACMYGGDENCQLSSSVVDHGELPESETWDYISHAAVGLALATGQHAFDNDVSKIFNYLRGGLPVVSEEPILNNDLVRQTGLGRVFRFGDAEDLAEKARELIENPLDETREVTMQFMAREHSWDKRVDVYVDLFSRICSGKNLRDLNVNPKSQKSGGI